MKIYTKKKTIIETNIYDDENMKISLIVTESPDKKEVKLLNEKDNNKFVFQTLEFDKAKKKIWLRVLKLLEKAVKGLEVKSVTISKTKPKDE